MKEENVAKAKSSKDKAEVIVLGPIEQVLADNPELAETLQFLTDGEKLIRLRQLGLVGTDVQ